MFILSFLLLHITLTLHTITLSLHNVNIYSLLIDLPTQMLYIIKSKTELINKSANHSHLCRKASFPNWSRLRVFCINF